jgi:cellulose synthase operon protein C
VIELPIIGGAHKVQHNKDGDLERSVEASIDAAAPTSNAPVSARLAHEIPKPRDWQAFQRNCALLFRAELNDPNAQEYGRLGQNQRGIDVLGKRNGNPDHYVGVQCRLIPKPLSEEVILRDCRAALGLQAGLKEIIFATTAPDDNNATDAAIRVERALRGEGHELSVVVYGWGTLQTLIAVHEVAYAAFCPSILGTSAKEAPSISSASTTEFADQVADRLVDRLRSSGLATPPSEVSPSVAAGEDAALHARIDTLRDLFKEEKELHFAEKGLLALLEKEPLGDKPWARFRIETILGSIALSMGREAEAAARFEAAYLVHPDDPNAVANLALARTIRGQYKEAMELAERALGRTPRPDHAVAYLLQAAARSDWQGNPQELIPSDLNGNEHADLGLAEFLRQREAPGWATHCMELSARHPEHQEFKLIRAIAVLSLALEAGVGVPGGRGAVTYEDLNRAADDMKAIAENLLRIAFKDGNDLAAHLNNAGVLLRLCGRHSECEELLRQGIPEAAQEPHLKRLLALSQAALGRRDDALATLALDQDAASQLLAIELAGLHDPAASLARVRAIGPDGLSPFASRLRLHLLGDLALKSRDWVGLEETLAAIRALDASDVVADLLEIRREQAAGVDQEAIQNQLRHVAAALRADADMATLYIVAEELQSQGLPEEAAKVLEPRVDLSMASPAAKLYLQSLAAARHDDAFRRSISAGASALQNDPEVLWTTAAHAWNLGDLPNALLAVNDLLQQQSDNAHARLLKIEILIRQNNSGELLAELINLLKRSIGPESRISFVSQLSLGISDMSNVRQALLIGCSWNTATFLKHG